MGKKSTENRRIVLEMLMELQSDPKAKEHVLLNNVLAKYDYMDRQDKAFITYLFEGVLRNRIKLDYIIDCFAKTKNGKMKPMVRNILRMTAFQIMYMDSVPGSAACNEAVNLMIDRGLSGLKGFVNGVSRNIERNKDNISWPDKNKELNKYLSVFYSMPQWIADYLIKVYGRESAEIMLVRMSKPSEVTIRVIDERVVKQLEDNGNLPVKHPYLDTAYKISKIDGMESVPGFYEGMFTVQDVSSQLAVYVAGIDKGSRILDLCSAPGGKTMYAAWLTGNEGSVDARELSEYKLDVIRENVERMKLENVSISQADATVYDENLADSYDVVIVDAPCSGLGVMGKKSDIRYNVTFNQIKELVDIQRKILTNAVKYLKAGGILMYMTCTITHEENKDNRNWILDNLPVAAVSFEELLPENLHGQGGSEGYLQLLPGVHDCDGFFISKYIKN